MIECHSVLLIVRLILENTKKSDSESRIVDQFDRQNIEFALWIAQLCDDTFPQISINFTSS
jgi:hypothetical protein